MPFDPHPIEDERVTAKSLPDVPSALLRVALKDLARARVIPGYKINMSVWHKMDDNKNCIV